MNRYGLICNLAALLTPIEVVTITAEDIQTYSREANPNGPRGSGERFDIHHNTFYKAVPYETAIIIKGLSSKGVSIHHNWFRDLSDIRQACAQNTYTDKAIENLHVYENVIRPDKTRKAEELHY